MDSLRSIDPTDIADTVARRTVLTLTLMLCCVLGLLTPYFLVVIGMVAFAVMLVRGTLRDAYRDNLAAMIFLAVFAMLAVCYALTAAMPSDVLLVFNFTMLVLFAPFHSLMLHGARPGNAIKIADLAFAGTLLAFLSAVIGIYFLGWSRAESPFFGAILLANTSLLLGFLSLVGVVARGERSLGYLFAPVLAVTVIALTGSRGPLLGVIPLTVLAAFFIGRELRLKPLLVAAVAIGYLVLCAVIVVALDSRSASLAAVVGQVAGGVDAITDDTASIRLLLWEAGYKAFLEHPIFGHGWARLMSSIRPFLTPENLHHAGLPQLHNDLVNFAVAAGVVGIGLYFVLIATPVVSALRMRRDSQSAPRLFGVLVLVVTYACAGLTDLMFGFEYHTALYVLVTAILLGYCRDDPKPVRR